MNKKIMVVFFFILSVISMYYFGFMSNRKLYTATWSGENTTLAITINGEISTTFPTSRAYDPIVECTSGTGKIEWKDSKWVLTTSGIEKGSTRCNVDFKNLPPFADSILANNTVQAPMTTPGSEVSTSGEALLASTEDDYGTSYYFRGAVKNNYVKFANKCWRIVRITGDRSVKLVLHNNNTSGVANPCASSNNSTSAAYAHYSGTTFSGSYNSHDNDNTYVGFMYGTAGASVYATTHANINKSVVLTNLETWYKNNLSSYTDKLADTIWCNDKSTRNGSNGYGTTVTDYGTKNRLVSSAGMPGGTGPSLICPNDNNGGKLSKFTVDDTVNGNGALTYKIGLLTADEVVFAGSISGTSNTSTYLYENTGTYYWWTLSPSYFDDDNSRMWIVRSGSLRIDNKITASVAIRPAISLSSSVSAVGTGTSSDPYVVD